MTDPGVEPGRPRENEKEPDPSGEGGSLDDEEHGRRDLRNREDDRRRRTVEAGKPRVEEQHRGTMSEDQGDEDSRCDAERRHFCSFRRWLSLAVRSSP